MSEENKAIVRGIYEAMNSGDLSGLAETISDSFVDHEELPGYPPTKEGTLQFFRALRDAFPDFRVNVEDMVAEDDKVIIRATMRGTHSGDFMGIAATGKQVQVPMADFLRLENGKVLEHWGVMDNGAMMQQLGVSGSV